MQAGTSKSGWLQEGAIWGSMLSKAMLPGDEELGKKDDDHKPGATLRIPAWPSLSTPLRWRRRRILLVVVGLYLLYVFMSNIPDLGELNGRRRPFVYDGEPIANTAEDARTQADDAEPTGPPPGTRAPKADQPAPHTYSGAIKFYRLSASLHGASHTSGYRTTNRNVLFAMSSLQSASTLLPIICEMSRWSRNWVHAAFMGREDIELAKILEINGIDQVKCPAIWHDARPDYTEYSDDARAESSVTAAMSHIHSFLHPQVAIIDDAHLEDDFFIRGMRAKTKSLNMPLIQGVKDRWDGFSWITRLDAGSLRSWHQPTVEILIQVPTASSSVVRLLKSIKNADYSGLAFPHITIDLPADVDESAEQYLRDFKWPPNSDTRQVSIRRRIANQRATQEDSAIRFLELFYPLSDHSHVLLLSPQIELSSQYYQYLKYVLMEYKYSSFAGDDGTNLLGTSLVIPSLLVDGKSKFTPPKPADMHTTRYRELFPDTRSVPFSMQAPNSHATLFFGDKWAELHSFLSSRVAKHYRSSNPVQRKKLVSETLPSWMEYMLEFMRARGYSLLYPGASSADSLITIHNELYSAPEEFAPPAPGPEKTVDPPKLPDEPFLRADEAAPRPKNPESHVIAGSRPLHQVLPFDGDLPEVPHMPYLLHTGKMIALANVSTIAAIYADKYREVVGGCTIPPGKRRKVTPGSARDLFCFEDDDDSDWETAGVDAVDAKVADDHEHSTSVRPSSTASATSRATSSTNRVASTSPTATPGA